MSNRFNGTPSSTQLLIIPGHTWYRDYSREQQWIHQRGLSASLMMTYAVNLMYQPTYDVVVNQLRQRLGTSDLVYQGMDIVHRSATWLLDQLTFYQHLQHEILNVCPIGDDFGVLVLRKETDL